MAQTAAGTVVGTTAHAPEAEALWFGYFSPEQTVWISVTIFILLAIVFGKLPKRIAEALDAKIADVRKQLDEAKALRVEAEALLAETRAKLDAAGRDAEAIISHARAEAAQLVETARTDADALIARRTRMAEDKIAAAERSATADLRARVATVAAEAARSVIRAQSTDADRTRLTDDAIASLGRR